MTYQPEEQITGTAASSAPRGIRNNAPNNNNASHAHDSRFDCNICLEPVTEPVVSRCGHLYCWPCLYRWLQPAMTEEERYEMGWENGSAAYFGGSANLSSGRGSSARRCCPVCKAPCSVRDVVPIYVRESDGNDDGAVAAGSSHDFDGIDESASITHQDSPADAAAEATASSDPTTLTGLRRRRGGGGGGGGGDNNTSGGGESSTLARGVAENYERNDDDDLSISTISTDDHVNTGAADTDAIARNGTIATIRPEGTSNAEIPSRPTQQPYLHQRSAGEDSTGMRPSDPTEAPRTPLINNRQQHQASTTGGGIRRPPISPPRGARPSSLSNGLSLTVWSGFVDALLGAQTNAGGRNNGTGAADADGGYVPPIHRPDNGRGPHRGSSAVSVGNIGGGAGHNRNEQGGTNGSLPAAAEMTRGRRWFNPTFVEDSTTEFLSRLLLMLGCFVVFCLLLF